MMPLRIALVGSLMGPDVFEIASMVGKNETVNRIETAMQKLG
jgi:glutamyl-tRNA synthetase